MSIRFPEADYFIAASRLRPGMDGGYTVSTLRRAQQFAEHAGVHPVLLTVDFWPDYDEVQAEFERRGLMSGSTVVRNLLQDARRDPSFLRAAASPGRSVPEAVPAGGGVAAGLVAGEPERDARGRPWRIIVSHAAAINTAAPDATPPAIAYTEFLGLDGRPVLRVPYVTGRADWHRAPLKITVFAEDGSPAGTLDGFGGLYRAWLDHVLDGRALHPPQERLAVVVCESRQLGELLVESPRQDLRLVHTVHSAHTAAPYEWDSPIDGLWESWLAVTDRFDAVLWPTQTQRRAVERRFGERDNFWVVPHAVEPEPAPPVAARDPNLAVMVGRLAALKRIDHTLQAFRDVAAGNPHARLAIYGEGPDEPRLRALVAEWGLEQVVEFCGYRPDAAEALAGAALLALSSTYEGQPLVILEALARGCPVVSYDLNYGPADMIDDGVNGLLVPNGDTAALAAALSSVLGHPERGAELSAAAHAWARAHGPADAMERMSRLLRAVVAVPRRPRK